MSAFLQILLSGHLYLQAKVLSSSYLQIQNFKRCAGTGLMHFGSEIFPTYLCIAWLKIQRKVYRYNVVDDFAFYGRYDLSKV